MWFLRLRLPVGANEGEEHSNKRCQIIRFRMRIVTRNFQKKIKKKNKRTSVGRGGGKGIASPKITWRFIYESTACRKPWYSMPHLSRTTTGFPVSSFRNGLGLTGADWKREEKVRQRSAAEEGKR